jgi:hypothetical protein
MRISSIGRSIAVIKQKFSQSLGLPFQEVLPESLVDEALEAEGICYRERMFSPKVTVWGFLSQVLDKDKSCQNVVSRIIAWLASAGKPVPSSDPSAYCQARKRLGEGVLRRLFTKVAENQQAQVSQEQHWRGHRVVIGAGSTVVMPDTPANQEAYPQHGTQAEGCGFPIARVVALFGLATGAVQELLISPWKTSELALARQLYPRLHPNDLFLADRTFCSYGDIYLLQQQHVEVLLRMHQRRKFDFRRGKRLGKKDHLVTWTKPNSCPKGLSREIYDQLPPTLTLRELSSTIEQKGFRTKHVTVVTTLLDPKRYPKVALAELYGLRWTAELDLRHLRSTMGMEMLTTKTPEMVRKEIYCHLLAYNLIRALMGDAALRHNVSPLRLSVQSTIRHLLNFLPQLAQAGRSKRARLYLQLLHTVAQEEVPKRPGRYHPRVRKRRPKPYPLMNKPRHLLRERTA